MLFGRYLIECCFENEAILPYFKGSTFRGVFGIALKRVVCALKQLKCEECLLSERCLYSRVFERTHGVQDKRKGKKDACPRPFVIEPPLSTKTHYPPGSSFDFNLILFGEYNKYLVYFVYALDQMGKIGIGKKINGRRGIYCLNAVTYGEAPVYTKEEKVLKLPEEVEEIVSDDFRKEVRCKKIKVDVITPLRLKFRNRLTDHLPFHVLVRAMLRRSSALFSWFDDKKLDLDYTGLVRRAEAVETVNSELKWFDWKRYSNRQDQAMLMGGIIGSVTYGGDLGEFVPFIDFCSRVHLGKQTTFGLGKISYEILE